MKEVIILSDVKWLTLKQISKELGIHIETIREWVREGLLPAYKFGRDYRVKQEDFDKFVEARRTKRDDT